MTSDDGDYEYAFMEIGAKGELTEKTARRGAEAILLMTQFNPTTQIAVTIGGYDNDPRELWDIPEAKHFFRLVVTALHASGRRFDEFNFVPDTIACLALCMGAGKITATHERGYTVEIGTPP
jgi:hypothetical protein